MEAKEKLIQLIKVFENNIERYKSSDYNEANTRVDFIDKFFELLEWDVRNEKGRAEQYRDVVREDRVYIKGKPKAPDYSFRIGGIIKFYVEAKKPSVDIKHDGAPALQIRRYGYTKKLPLSILTDFEEFAVYDTRVLPKPDDKAGVGRIFYCTYDELLKPCKIKSEDYETNFDFIYHTFSKDGIENGSFDKYVAKAKKGTSEVDKELLKLIDEWRNDLATNIALRNKELDIHQLNMAVQKLIDRLIFLRIAEDRNMEDYGMIKEALDNDNIYESLNNIFDNADLKYNSGLFDNPDWMDSLIIDNKKLKGIIEKLYYPVCPYEFSVMPIEILGHVYEQFLGKSIRLTPSHQAKIEDKPEVRKAGGVFYTPEYIVNYIVENTVGVKIDAVKRDERLKGLTPTEKIEKTDEIMKEIKVLDPACGSGSFLIGAYDFLLKQYHEYYTVKDRNIALALKKDYIYKTNDGSYKLTIVAKRDILVNNIFGVDIDRQAVEVTKLSLLLKLLEDEDIEENLFAAEHDLLPNLSNNIKCGNSLVGNDFYQAKEGQAQQEYSDEEVFKINAFDWKEEFKDIFANGGFDCVIGNPPYLRIQGLQEYFGNQLEYFVKKFKSAVKRYDIYLLFIENGFNLLSEDGLLGYICPHKFINSDFGSGIREFLIENNALETLISFGNNLIFSQASTYTGLLFLKKSHKSTFKYYEFEPMNIPRLTTLLFNLKNNNYSSYNLETFSKKAWILTTVEIKSCIDKIINNGERLHNVFEGIFQGVVTGADEIYLLKKVCNDSKDNLIEVYSERKNKIVTLESDILKPMLKGNSISRFSEPIFDYYCIYPYKIENNKTKILEEKELSDLYPLTFKYLKSYKSELKKLRIKFKTNPNYWYSCHRGRDMNIFEQNKIVTPYTSLGCNLSIAHPGVYHNTKVYSLIPHELRKESLYYWLGVLNSKVLWFWVKNTGYVLRGGYYTFTTDYLSPYPVPTIDISNPEEKEQHDKVVLLVESMLELHKNLNNTEDEKEQKDLQVKIDNLDKEINQLVYQLYDLTEKEIKTVERSL